MGVTPRLKTPPTLSTTKPSVISSKDKMHKTPIELQMINQGQLSLQLQITRKVDQERRQFTSQEFLTSGKTRTNL